MAIEEISTISNVEVIRLASGYVTKAWGVTDQNDFINTVVKIETGRGPQLLLAEFQKIEKKLGRVKNEKWGPRIIDIDILLYGNIMVNQDKLTIPHPYIKDRSFVYVPLLELNPHVKIPNDGKLSELVDRIKGKKEIVSVFKWQKNNIKQ